MNIIREIKLSQNDFLVFFDNTSLKLNCKMNLDVCVVDISNMNLIDAVKFAVLCSTYCFVKKFKNKISWVVADEEIKKAISILSLKNIKSCLVADKQTEGLVRAS